MIGHRLAIRVRPLGWMRDARPRCERRRCPFRRVAGMRSPVRWRMREARSASLSGRFAALNNRQFRILFVGGLFTFLTMQVAGVARAWLAFELTGTNTGLGGVMLAFGACSIFVIPYGGMISDRFSKRNVLVCGRAPFRPCNPDRAWVWWWSPATRATGS